MTEDPKRQAVLRSAYDVFTRYGYTRTTMGDLAEAAGMSRPALYLVFPNKEDLFDAVISWAGKHALQQLQAEIDQQADTEQKLVCACIGYVTGQYKIAQTYPDASDFYDPRFKASARIYQQFQQLLTTIFAEHAGRADITAEDRARVLVLALKGFQKYAGDEADLNHLIRVQIQLMIRSA